MEIDFFRRHGAQRMRGYSSLPPLLTDGTTLDEPDTEQVVLDYEQPSEEWQPIDVENIAGWQTSSLLPQRFIDGKDVGDTVAWLQSAEGYPVPVRLSQIGAVALHVVDGELRRESVVPLERVVSMIVDLFPWDEIERLALDLQENGFRLLPSAKPDGSNDPANGNLLFDFERMRKTTQNRSNDEMIRLERQVLAQDAEHVAVVDGRLDPRAGAFDAATTPVIGVIKTHNKAYLHARGWSLFYSLQVGQRTPAFLLRSVEPPAAIPGQARPPGQKLNVEVVTWYLRLDGNRGELPNWGIVRVELAREYFEARGKDPALLNQVSCAIRAYRCRDAGYSRAPVSLYPIQRAEESLGALFTQGDQLNHRFYRIAGV